MLNLATNLNIFDPYIYKALNASYRLQNYSIIFKIDSNKIAQVVEMLVCIHHQARGHGFDSRCFP